MFAGRYEYAIDDKSRVSIPAKFREALSTNYDIGLSLQILMAVLSDIPTRNGFPYKIGHQAPVQSEKRQGHFSDIFTLGYQSAP